MTTLTETPTTQVKGWRYCEAPGCPREHGHQFYSKLPSRLCPECAALALQQQVNDIRSLAQDARDFQVGDQAREEHERTCPNCVNSQNEGPLWARRIRCPEYPS